MSEPSQQSSRRRDLAVIFLVSMAGLLLEVAYTRIISYKLWYFYTYLVIGLALLGVGSGGIFLATIPRLRAASTTAIVRWSCTAAAVTIPLGYILIAKLPITTYAIWSYSGRPALTAVLKLALICFVLFASFIAIGLVVSTILGRASEGVGRLYFGDLIGAGLGCIVAIPCIVWMGPPAVVVVAAAVMAIASLVCAEPAKRWSVVLGGALSVVLIVVVAANSVLPDITPEGGKSAATHALYSA